MTEFTPVTDSSPENLDLDSIPPLDPLLLSASDPNLMEQPISDLDYFLKDGNVDLADMDFDFDFDNSDDFFNFDFERPDEVGSSEDQKPEEIVIHSNFDSPEGLEGGTDSVHSQVSSEGSKTFVPRASDTVAALSSPESSNLGLHQKSSVSKRKKEKGDSGGESRSCKYRKSDDKSAVTNEDDDDKKKERLIRNRESAQLSRLRKKQYVEDLQGKVKRMHSTITELNSKISYVMAENAALKQQMAAASGAPPIIPYMAAPPLPYQWMPYALYPVRVPIPKLKPQPVQRCRPKKPEGKKNVAKSNIKKVASVSFIGIMFFFFLFSTLVPFMNGNYGGDSRTFGGLSSYEGNRYFDEHKGKVLMVGDGSDVRKESGGKVHSSMRDSWGGVDYNTHPKLEGRPSLLCNASEPLFASLYVPRNDELVKIDGNLIIHSVLASEKAMAYANNNTSETLKSKETDLKIPGALSSALAVPEIRGNAAMLPHSTALSSGSAEGKRLQQWFHEGGSGTLMDYSMCTEVFQFDIAPGAIVPSSVSNISAEHLQDVTTHKRLKNRRILEKLPVSLMASKLNISGTQKSKDSQNKSFHENTNKPTSSSSMVVSVLLDPRDIIDSETVKPTNPNSLSRIFVVVLLDSVKYVTYSCVLPRSGLIS